MSDHLTVTCDHTFHQIPTPTDPSFGALLEAIQAACAVSDRLVRRLDWWKPTTQWEAFEPSHDSRKDITYVTAAPGMIVALAPRTLRIHTPIALDLLKGDQERFMDVRRYFEVLSRRIGRGWVLYTPCGGAVRDQITEWAVEGLTAAQIAERAHLEYGITPKSVVRRRSPCHPRPHKRDCRPDRNQEVTEIYEDWFEDIRAPVEAFTGQRASITRR